MQQTTTLRNLASAAPCLAIALFAAPVAAEGERGATPRAPVGVAAPGFSEGGDFTVGGSLGVGTDQPLFQIHQLEAGLVDHAFELIDSDSRWSLVTSSFAGDPEVAGDFGLDLETGPGLDQFVTGFLNLEDDETGPLRRGLGIHTFDPTAYLHVRACAGCKSAPLLKLDGTTLPTGVPVQLQILSPDTRAGTGSAALTYQDVAAGESATFEFRTLGGVPFFALNFVGTGGTEFEIDKDGRFRLGRGGAQRFLVDAQGDVFATSYNLASARELKESFEPVSPADVLRAVVALDVQRWSYRGEAAVRHIGPTAEDFHARFAVGEDPGHISVVDAAGVSLAAIQGLYRELQELRTALAERDAALDALVERNEALERRLRRVEERGSRRR